jgi:class 3 adenylate cyclase/tetratricopeptide (TPR) repeat protein
MVYTPKHLAEKILTSRAALEGERKQVTVLFADVKGSMELAEQLDPEEWSKIMQRFFQILADGVERFEGFVDKFTGDGIMALFGAPIAHEDHAQRACYAALHLRDELKRYATELRLSRGLDFSVRMGLNSGNVVVGRIGDDLRMEYTAQGHTVGLAQRMEQVAAAHAICLSEATAKAVSGYFALHDLGPARIKGASELLRVFELEGMSTLRTRLEVARSRGLTRFVGRDAEMDVLEAALARARAGNGQVIGLVAEAGVGKSRLCYEFTERCRAAGMRVIEGRCASYGKNIPLLPILQIFRHYYGITEHDSDRTAREKIAGHLLLLDEAYREVLPVVFEFFGVPDPDRPVPRLDPEAKQRQLVGVLRNVVQHGAEDTVALIEDLHWIDGASAAWLEQWVDAVAGARIVLVVNFRPEFEAAWMRKSYYQQLALAPLSTQAVHQLLESLLGRDPSIAGLADAIHARTGGNPFFTEEVVQSLIESGKLQGSAGAYRLTAPVETLDVPASVHAVLAARIDRLPEREKQLLQTAAVIGKDFSEPVLVAVVLSSPGPLPGEASSFSNTPSEARSSSPHQGLKPPAQDSKAGEPALVDGFFTHRAGLGRLTGLSPGPLAPGGGAHDSSAEAYRPSHPKDGERGISSLRTLDDLRAALRTLAQAEFVYEQALYPVAEYTFKHPLTQQVAYDTLLRERRARVHAAVAVASAEFYAEKLDEKAALLAHHWENAGETRQAALWHKRAAEWAGVANAAEGVRHWERVRGLVRTLPHTRENSQLGATACLANLGLVWRLGTSTAEAADIFEEGRRLAEESGDVRTLAALHGNYGGVLGIVDGDSDEYLRYAREATRLADQTDDQGLQLAERSYWAFACLFAGRLGEGIEACDTACKRPPADPALGREFTGYSPFLGLLNAQAWILCRLGRLNEAAAVCERGEHLARVCQDNEVLNWMQLPRILLDTSCAAAAAARDHARCALEAGEKAATPQVRMTGLIALGIAHRLNTEWAESVAVLVEAVNAAISGANRMVEGWVRAELAEALLGRGELDRAEQEAQAAVTVSQAHHNRCDEARAHLALARTQLRRTDAAALERAEQALVRAEELIGETGAQAYQPEVHECRAQLARRRGDEQGTRLELQAAQRLYAEMGAPAQVERLVKEMVQ